MFLRLNMSRRVANSFEWLMLVRHPASQSRNNIQRTNDFCARALKPWPPKSYQGATIMLPSAVRFAAFLLSVAMIAASVGSSAQEPRRGAPPAVPQRPASPPAMARPSPPPMAPPPPPPAMARPAPPPAMARPAPPAFRPAPPPQPPAMAPRPTPHAPPPPP